VSANSGGRSRESQQTYYPGIADKTKAVAVKVKAGAETSAIDFKLAPPKKKGYEVRGRVIDESGKAVSGVMIGCSPVHETEGDEKDAPSGFAVPAVLHSNAQGESKSPGIGTGKDQVSGMSLLDEASVYGDPTTFEVAGRDIRGVEIKTPKGLTAGGTVVIEG